MQSGNEENFIYKTHVHTSRGRIVGRAENNPLRAQQLAAGLEVEMMADMSNRMTNACHQKSMPPHYKDAELSKAATVCLDILERMGKKLTELSMQDEELMKRVQQSSRPGHT
ncbi:mitochondrial import inner membrane translocase subunit Tim10-like [Ochotona curzoniae]|uniref:mitochondrial import inner membrane translocase subunit Tim10-like n=1 Tax=Ochotona curzoniae TaxID=130825 RepID=UPI001B353411|nr:mitochondrial import inner membrane translocase subunit Tim10-like [Ochotona curzoniae]